VHDPPVITVEPRSSLANGRSRSAELALRHYRTISG
jgi:hypothetical protein